MIRERNDDSQHIEDDTWYHLSRITMCMVRGRKDDYQHIKGVDVHCLGQIFCVSVYNVD